ncbi:MAG: rod-binding protein [Magnetococcales bacterium]|nr:rod-binding protein [Magnetococcales bacterium]
MTSITPLPPAPEPLKKADAPPAISPSDLRRLNDATADFEALFLQQLFKSMRNTVPTDPNGGLFAKGPGEKLFQEMLDGEYAKNFSRGRNGLGLKEAIFKQTVARQLAVQGVDVKKAVNRLYGSENPSNVIPQSPIGKETAVGYGAAGAMDAKTERPKPAGPEIFKEP